MVRVVRKRDLVALRVCGVLVGLGVAATVLQTREMMIPAATGMVVGAIAGSKLWNRPVLGRFIAGMVLATGVGSFWWGMDQGLVFITSLSAAFALSPRPREDLAGGKDEYIEGR